MGWFDRFRKPQASVSLSQLCYDVAYRILPQFAHTDIAKVVDLCEGTPNAAGPFFYVMACQMSQVEPDIPTARRFRWHLGKLADQAEFFVLEYPTPPPIDLSHVGLEELVSAATPFVLAPFFSAIVRAVPEGEVRYFILGQAPMGGGTTLRSVLANGMNSNLGPGPESRLDLFLDVIRRRWDANA